MEQGTYAYFYLLIVFFAMPVVGVAVLALSFCLARKVAKAGKPVARDGYAGGFYLLSSTRRRFPVRFAAAALAALSVNVFFLMLMPWILNMRAAGCSGLACALFFAAQGCAGFWYAVKKGAFEWK